MFHKMQPAFRRKTVCPLSASIIRGNDLRARAPNWYDGPLPSTTSETTTTAAHARESRDPRFNWKALEHFMEVLLVRLNAA